MNEILQNLADDAVVLDLGSGPGTFEDSQFSFLTVHVDVDSTPLDPEASSLQADAAYLPFGANMFDAIIANHSIEHFQDLNKSLAEIGRVLKPAGALFAAVPDSTTLTDRLYRWLARGGGHLNAFDSRDDLVSTVESLTGMRCSAVRPLCSSLSFLNRKNRKGRSPRKLLLLGGGNESVLQLFGFLLRFVDRLFQTRLSSYGWALFLGEISSEVSTAPWANVCVRCGSGHPSDWLLSSEGLLRKWLFLKGYLCPTCGTENIFTADSHLEHWLLR